MGSAPRGNKPSGVVLMLTGIGVIGMFTATIASFFMVEEEQSEIAAMRDQLKRIEQKLDSVIEEQRVEKSLNAAARANEIERV